MIHQFVFIKWASLPLIKPLVGNGVLLVSSQLIVRNAVQISVMIDLFSAKCTPINQLMCSQLGTALIDQFASCTDVMELQPTIINSSVAEYHCFTLVNQLILESFH